jgi:hypothetical protein
VLGPFIIGCDVSFSLMEQQRAGEKERRAAQLYAAVRYAVTGEMAWIANNHGKERPSTVPRELREQGGLTDRERRVLAHIAYYDQLKRGGCLQRDVSIAVQLGIPVQALKDTLYRLRKGGWLASRNGLDGRRRLTLTALLPESRDTTAGVAGRYSRSSVTLPGKYTDGPQVYANTATSEGEFETESEGESRRESAAEAKGAGAPAAAAAKATPSSGRAAPSPTPHPRPRPEAEATNTAQAGDLASSLLEGREARRDSQAASPSLEKMPVPINDRARRIVEFYRLAYEAEFEHEPTVTEDDAAAVNDFVRREPDWSVDAVGAVLVQAWKRIGSVRKKKNGTCYRFGACQSSKHLAHFFRHFDRICADVEDQAEDYWDINHGYLVDIIEEFSKLGIDELNKFFDPELSEEDEELPPAKETHQAPAQAPAPAQGPAPQPQATVRTQVQADAPAPASAPAPKPQPTGEAEIGSDGLPGMRPVCHFGGLKRNTVTGISDRWEEYRRQGGTQSYVEFAREACSGG